MTMTEINGPMLQVGTVLDEKWVILEFIDKDGMGEVYRAHQLNLKRDVAIKRASIESFGRDAGEIKADLRNFRCEVEAMAQINHTAAELILRREA